MSVGKNSHHKGSSRSQWQDSGLEVHFLKYMEGKSVKDKPLVGLRDGWAA